jgi:hypothetical protein
MSEMSERARDRAKSKVERLTRSNSGSIDASGWREPLGENGMVQTGPRPVSRRQFKRGGKVEGAKAIMHAGRKPRKAGGRTSIDGGLINTDVKAENESRDGTKHIGGMKKGGRAHKMMGGAMGSMGGMERPEMRGMPMARPGLQQRPGMMARKDGGKAEHGKSCDCAKCSGGRVGKKAGGSIADGTRPMGDRIARAKGGRAKKGTTVNIIIAPSGGGGAKPPMPMPPGGPVGMHQGAPPPPPMAPPGAAPPMGPPPMMRADGGRAVKPGKYPIKNGAGGGLGRLEKARAYG